MQALYLSKNFLCRLDGAVQFHGLAKLSAADNRLANHDVLDALAPLAGSLTAANFEGNPMARLPNYRAHVRAALPSKPAGNCCMPSPLMRQHVTSSHAGVCCTLGHI